MKGLYIHIPFCDHICVYCDFLKFIAKESLQEQYINALCKEINIKLDNKQLSNIDTIYIGGGTPSSLPLYLLSLLFNTLDKVVSINKIKEYTFELNPTDIINKKDALLSLLKKHNVNRLSIGVQSFNNQKLKFMRRTHTKKQAIESINLSKKYFNNISIDLIYGFEKDTFPMIRKDIDFAYDLGIKHISCYSLILEDRSILKTKIDKNEFTPMDPDKEARIYYKLVNYLNEKDYTQYEISNFASLKYQSLHNKKYWNSELYEACGIGASSYCYINKEYHRIKNITKVNDYINILSKETINLNDLILEDIIYNKKDIMDMEIDLSLRLNTGIDKSDFVKKYGKTVYTVYPNINNLVNMGILIDKNNRIYINEKYKYLHTTIVEKII